MDEVGLIPWRCPILELPAEIRIEIYRHLFADAQLFLQGKAKFFHCGPELCSCDFPWQILGTCRRLRQDALPYLLAATTLRFASTLENADRLPQNYLAAISQAVICRVDAIGSGPLQLERFRGLKVLEVRDLVIWCKYYDQAYLETPTADEGMIGLALFNLKRSTLNLTICYFDTQRVFKILLHCHFVTSSSSKSIVSRKFFSSSLLPPPARMGTNCMQQHAIIDLDEKAVIHKSRGPPIRDRHTWAGFY
ncbi:hypothetical protein EDD37DRAFT_393427 [Exophiala viscosa]|uniref:uncharacterized protein n=1 Tax=Exophiala viscosa TaxID=2486360 RepID=UPI00219C1A99|nr:hypothetical protein EDD37DRAFT_393427 [Exophiala viscosa]